MSDADDTQVRMARAALNWAVRDLGNVTAYIGTQSRIFEVRRYGGDPQTLESIEKMRFRTGVEFIPENGGSPGVH